jgi:hypothetical protein
MPDLILYAVFAIRFDGLTDAPDSIYLALTGSFLILPDQPHSLTD